MSEIVNVIGARVRVLLPSSFLDGDDAGAGAVAGAGEVKTRSSIESLASVSGAAAV